MWLEDDSDNVKLPQFSYNYYNLKFNDPALEQCFVAAITELEYRHFNKTMFVYSLCAILSIIEAAATVQSVGAKFFQVFMRGTVVITGIIFTLLLRYSRGARLYISQILLAVIFQICFLSIISSDHFVYIFFGDFAHKSLVPNPSTLFIVGITIATCPYFFILSGPAVFAIALFISVLYVSLTSYQANMLQTSIILDIGLTLLIGVLAGLGARRADKNARDAFVDIRSSETKNQALLGRVRLLELLPAHENSTSNLSQILRDLSSVRAALQETWLDLGLDSTVGCIIQKSVDSLTLISKKLATDSELHLARPNFDVMYHASSSSVAMTASIYDRQASQSSVATSILTRRHQKQIEHSTKDFIMANFTRIEDKNIYKYPKNKKKFIKNITSKLNFNNTIDSKSLSILLYEYNDEKSKNIIKGCRYWEFNTLLLSNFTIPIDKKCVYISIPIVFVGRELLIKSQDILNIDNNTLLSFLFEVNSLYRSSNPYHNETHGADVCSSLYFITGCVGIRDDEPEIYNKLWQDPTDSVEIEPFPERTMEEFASLIAALCHDVAHPGLNNAFLVNGSDELAVVYNDKSILENFHAATTFQILNKCSGCNILKSLSSRLQKYFRQLVVSLILGTDMSLHFDFLKSIQTRFDGGSKFNLALAKDRQILLSLCMKAADLGHSGKPWAVHNRWSLLVIEEFHQQGDREMSLGLPISPLCNREDTNTAASQVGFLKVVCRPTFELLAQCDNNGMIENTILRLLDKNIKEWSTILENSD
eukprot:GHVL01004571.1.p1 GENE.GHVL01004571.1~~GHVL01004571.1.p1  ORF type:complete len:764 (+),score=140.07 GHVL01004571.1:38-2329(+)